MGLDIYLSAVTYRFEYQSDEHQEAFSKIIAAVGLDPNSRVGCMSYVTVKVNLAHMKNAYSIWYWFTVNAQDGEARRVETRVYAESLQQLLETCQRLLVRRDRKEAEAALPLPPGLFEDIEDEDIYWRDSFWWHVESAVLQLSEILDNPQFANNWEFEYVYS